MIGSRTLRVLLLALLCIVTLDARSLGARVHLCLDGGQAPVTMHLSAGDVHPSAAGMLAPHQDFDLSLIGQAFGKIGKLLLDPPVLIGIACLLWALDRAFRHESPGDRALVRGSSPRFTRPPLRGPPSLTSL